MLNHKLLQLSADIWSTEVLAVCRICRHTVHIYLNAIWHQAIVGWGLRRILFKTTLRTSFRILIIATSMIVFDLANVLIYLTSHSLCTSDGTLHSQNVWDYSFHHKQTSLFLVYTIIFSLVWICRKQEIDQRFFVNYIQYASGFRNKLYLYKKSPRPLYLNIM